MGNAVFVLTIAVGFAGVLAVFGLLIEQFVDPSVVDRIITFVFRR